MMDALIAMRYSRGNTVSHRMDLYWGVAFTQHCSMYLFYGDYDVWSEQISFRYLNKMIKIIRILYKL